MLINKETDIRNIELALTRRALSVTDYTISDAVERREWRERIEDISDGRNTVLYNAENMPGIYVRVPSVWQSQLDLQFSEQIHPAFIVNGNVKDEILIGKYQGCIASKAGTDYALSLAGVDPAVNIDFDDSLAANANNGAGFHLMTNAEWAFLALLSYQQGYEPRGNTNFGSSHIRSGEKGRPASQDSSQIVRTMTGSGSRAWALNGSPFGIYDLVGNVWEWVSGYRLNDGEINIIENNNAADSNNSQASGSAEWQALLQSGSLVDPGTADTLKWYDRDGDSELNTITNAGDEYWNAFFRETMKEASVTVPDILKLLGIYPAQTDINNGYYYIMNYEERMAIRGGGYGSGSRAGVFCAGLTATRLDTNQGYGFRPAFVNL